jgi:hypothetical protein
MAFCDAAEVPPLEEEHGLGASLDCGRGYNTSLTDVQG